MKERRNIFISIICLLVLIALIGVPKLFLDKKDNVLPEVKLKEIEKNKTFAIMVPDINGKGYVPYAGDKWPTEANDYYYSHSECVDNRGEKVENAIVYNEKENTALLDTSETIYCTLYFDKYPYMKVITHDVTYDSEGHTMQAPDYMSEKVKKVEFVNYIDTSKSTKSWDLSDTSRGTPKGSVIAWIEPNKDDTSYDTLYIGSKNKIKVVDFFRGFQAGEYESNSTESKTNLESVNFNNMLDTSKTTNMYSLFRDEKKLTKIEGIDNWDLSNVKSMQYMFYNCTLLNDINILEKWNTENLENISWMFTNCDNITDFSAISNWNTSKVKRMEGMFRDCGGLTTLNYFSKWDVSNVTDMWMLFCITNITNTNGIANWKTQSATDINGMFYNCDNLDNIDLSNWNVSNVTNMKSLAPGSEKLTAVNLKNWNTQNVTNMVEMFAHCTSLREINMQSATFTQIKDSTNYQNMFLNVPASVTIIVKDQEQKEWIKNTANFPGTVNTI